MGVLTSLVSWSPWTNRLLEERNDKTMEVARQGKVTSSPSSPSSPAQHQEDKKSGSKKVVTWDELVHVRKFQPFEEEFARRNGSPRVRRPTRHADQSNQEEEFATGVESRYVTSPMYD